MSDAPPPRRARSTAIYSTFAERPDGEPERRSSPRGRLGAIEQRLRGRSIPGVVRRDARLADRAMLERVHTRAYLDRLWWLRSEAGRVYSHRAVLPGSLEQLLWSAGAVVTAIEELLDGAFEGAAVFGEPPGHHAERDRGMGFCAVNNVAIAVAHAIATRRVGRVLIVDWDVHHGNGTQQAFEARGDVCFFDLHQHPLYPGTGHASETGVGDGRGATWNVPLPMGLGDADYEQLCVELLEPLAAAFRPELVVVSAGFDAHAGDPLGGMQLTSGGFARLTALVQRLADATAGGRLLLALEGGYEPAALAESAVACVEVLAGAAPPRPAGRAGPAARQVIDEVRAGWRAAGVPPPAALGATGETRGAVGSCAPVDEVLMRNSELMGFTDGMLAICRSQFPKSCGTCATRYESFDAYVGSMQPIGAPIPDEADETDPIGLLSMANCHCGSTLALRCGDVAPEVHHAFQEALTRECEASGRTRAQVLVELREILRSRGRGG